MTSRLTKEFKKEAHEHILSISKKYISKYFDKEQNLEAHTARSWGPKTTIVDNDQMKVEISMYFTDGKPKVINIENEQMKIEIGRHCFPNINGSFNYEYYEDYHVDIVTTIENVKIWSHFYLEWKNQDMDTELIYSGDGKKIKQLIK